MSSIRPTKYTIKPDDIEDCPFSDPWHFYFYVELRDEEADLWAVHQGYSVCFDQNGNESSESLPSSRTVDWLAQYRHTKADALEIAGWLADSYKHHGVRTYKEECERARAEM